MLNNRVEFIDYCFDFYGAGGLYDLDMTREELIEGLERRLKNRPDVPYDGDTVDRELVYGEVVAMQEEEAE